MSSQTFIKTLSANDVGTTGGHMGGILVPKGDGELLAFLPKLDPSVLNPCAWIDCKTPEGDILRLRFVYYNNRLHAPKGTRNEYRITYLTKFLRDAGAKEGDTFEITKDNDADHYSIRVITREMAEQALDDDDGPVRIKLATGWRRVH
ncbi:restriction endonuclease [Rhodovulum viride]|uniref:Restriction endonuclease n=1 Tax=Rhodovulum viride TaxID=1231134 RepID=A0ABX9DG94_9RHOB|nr:EcoRII N-terminal effector-binding domain-containing protein [Rhodovulum viride]RAP40416.1 restriction endonuclease [Rhodovulum viride]